MAILEVGLSVIGESVSIQRMLDEITDITNIQDDNIKNQEPESDSYDTGDPADTSDGNPLAEVEQWKQLYFEEISVAIAYSESISWDGIRPIVPETHDWMGNYLITPYSFKLFDLNFDGIPELIVFGDGVSADTLMTKIFTIVDNRVEMIANTSTVGYFWEGFIWQPYRKISDSSLNFFLFTGGDGPELYGDIHVTTESTYLDRNFIENSKIAHIAIHNIPDGEEFYVHFFNEREVSESEYNLLLNNLLIGYERIEYTPRILETNIRSWNNLPTVTDPDIWDFLNGYQGINLN
jgi:hypothetical protein